MSTCSLLVVVCSALCLLALGLGLQHADGLIRCSYEPNQALDLHVYVSPQRPYVGFSPEELVWRVEGFKYGLSAGHRSAEVTVQLGEHAESNTTLYAHIFLTPLGTSPDPADASHDRRRTSAATHALVSRARRPRFKSLRNLLTGARPGWQLELEALPEVRRHAELVPHWTPALSVNLIVDHESYEPDGVPSVLWEHWRAQRLFSAQRREFRPILFVNELELTAGRLLPLNATLPAVPLSLSVQPMSVGRFVWMLNLRASFAAQEASLGISEKESEDLRAMFVQTNPYLLYATVGVSALHLLFDLLAFQSDLAFWRSVQSMEGLSARSLLANFAMEAVVLAYLVDEGSSWLVQVTSALSLLVGAFKILKSSRVARKDAAARAGGGPSETDAIDALAYRRLTPPLCALVLGYAAYELAFDFHRSWAAWLLNCAVALVYGVGFVVMTPQLFINYKLKSVAHLPWKFFLYKFLNTFIDDLFAFIIKMPNLHRVAVFRDDIVFFAFLYQRYVYPVDRRRTNEFGTTGEGAGVGAPAGAREGPPAARKGALPKGGARQRSGALKSKKAE